MRQQSRGQCAECVESVRASQGQQGQQGVKKKVHGERRDGRGEAEQQTGESAVVQRMREGWRGVATRRGQALRQRRRRGAPAERAAPSSLQDGPDEGVHLRQVHDSPPARQPRMDANRTRVCCRADTKSCPTENAAFSLVQRFATATLPRVHQLTSSSSTLLLFPLACGAACKRRAGGSRGEGRRGSGGGRRRRGARATRHTPASLAGSHAAHTPTHSLVGFGLALK